MTGTVRSRDSGNVAVTSSVTVAELAEGVSVSAPFLSVRSGDHPAVTLTRLSRARREVKGSRRVIEVTSGGGEGGAVMDALLLYTCDCDGYESDTY